MNKKGQALIEFIIVLPIILVFIIGIFDFGNILYNKYRLENSLDHIKELYYQGELNKIDMYVADEKINYNIESDKITVEKKMNISAPGLNLILGDPFYIKTDGIIYE